MPPFGDVSESLDRGRSFRPDDDPRAIKGSGVVDTGNALGEKSVLAGILEAFGQFPEPWDADFPIKHNKNSGRTPTVSGNANRS